MFSNYKYCSLSKPISYSPSNSTSFFDPISLFNDNSERLIFHTSSSIYGGGSATQKKSSTAGGRSKKQSKSKVSPIDNPFDFDDSEDEDGLKTLYLI